MNFDFYCIYFDDYGIHTNLSKLREPFRWYMGHPILIKDEYEEIAYIDPEIYIDMYEIAEIDYTIFFSPILEDEMII